MALNFTVKVDLQNKNGLTFKSSIIASVKYCTYTALSCWTNAPLELASCTHCHQYFSPPGAFIRKAPRTRDVEMNCVQCQQLVLAFNLLASLLTLPFKQLCHYLHSQPCKGEPIILSLWP